jgi:3-hydroxyacyl-CoA dehydrogenase/enoyl-CoA hydratase/3-hydroxybutyryl-CoA epimerase
MDELTLSLPRKIREDTKAAVKADGGAWRAHGSEAVVDAMLDVHGRAGRLSRAGFYDYDESGHRTRIWPGLRASFRSGSADVPLPDLQERMLFAEAIEAVRCLEEGVLRSVADANVGSIQGIGFPAWTGGVLQYVRQYPGGLPGFVDRCRDLAGQYGPHFEPPPSLVKLAASGGWYE